MRVYIPPKQKKTTVYSFLGILAGCVFFIISYFAKEYRGIIQLAAFGAWAFGMWVACRYALVSYYYIVDGTNFRIVKVSGEKQQDVGNISLRTAVFLKKVSEAKDRPPVRNRFNYCRNFAADEKYVYAFEWNGSSAEIIFEPNEEFADIMRAAIELAKGEASSEPTNGWYEE